MTRLAPLSRQRRLLFWALLVWAFAGRLWFATPQLNASRFWDERYSLANVASVLRTGNLAPVNGYHPSLSYLPQAAVLAAATALHTTLGWPPPVRHPGGGFSPAGYFLCRSTQVLLGVASLALLVALGRRLFDDETALLAAFLMAVTPWHIRQSAIYKPDILLLALLLVAFLASLEAVHRPTLRGYLLAGLAIGGAMASKFNGGPIAIPLAVGSLWHWRSRRRVRFLLWLGAAGLVALATFLLLNPWLLLEPEIYRRDFSRTLRDYARKGARSGFSHWTIGLHALTSLLSSNFHGPVIGLLAIAGLLVLTLASLRRSNGSEATEWRLGWWLALSFVAGYALLYSFTTTNPSEHNWIPYLPFSSLAAAWILVRLRRLAAARWSPAARPAVVAAAYAVLVALLAAPASLLIYRVAVRATAEVAGRYVRSHFPTHQGRLVVSEVGIAPGWIGQGSARPAVLRVERLDRLPPETLTRADALIFRRDRLEGPGSTTYRRLLDRGESTAILPRPLRVRGTALQVVLQPLRKKGRPRHGALEPRGEPPGGGLATATLDALAPGELVSLDLRLTLPRGTPLGRLVRSGETEIGCVLLGRDRRSLRCLTPRFRVARPLVVQAPETAAAHSGVTVYIWRRRHR